MAIVPEKIPDLKEKRFRELLHKTLEKDEKTKLKSYSFSNWDLKGEKYETMLSYMGHMFKELGLLDANNTTQELLERFLIEVYNNYNREPAFHCFRHCFMVTQFAYCLICNNKLDGKLDKQEQLSLLLAAACHDFKHEGLSNKYYKKLKPRWWNRHKNLENYHYEIAQPILSNTILSDMEEVQRNKILTCVKTMIEKTDLAQHDEEIKKFNKKDSWKTDRQILLNLMMKACDLSNECRPIICGDTWLQHLQEEFKKEVKLFEEKGQPRDEEVVSHLKNSKITIYEPEKNQIFFIERFVKPLMEALAKALPAIREDYIKQLLGNLEEYQRRLANKSIRK